MNIKPFFRTNIISSAIAPQKSALVVIIIKPRAIYVLLSPKLSVSGRERNVFILSDKDKNDLIKTDGKTELTLCKSKLYGTYVYEAELKKNVLDGKIVRRPAIWGSIPLPVKIICLILSEILIFVWLFGRIIYFFRTANLPYRLTRKLKSHGFELFSFSSSISGTSAPSADV